MTRALDLPLPDGSTVAACADSPDHPRAGYVFAHGAGAGMRHPFMEALAHGLAGHGVACLRFQFPFMERGGRRPDPPAAAQAAVRAAVAEAGRRWPGLPLFAGGKSFGARMSSQAQAAAPLPGVRGLVFVGFPLHAAGKPSLARAAHLAQPPACSSETTPGFTGARAAAGPARARPPPLPGAPARAASRPPVPRAA